MQTNEKGSAKMAPGPMRCVGHAQYLNVTNATAVVPWTTAPNNGNTGSSLSTTVVPPTVAVISTEANAIRFLDDGTAPTATLGVYVPTGIVYTYSGDLTTLQIIANANNANVNISYYA